MFFLDKRW